MQRNTKNTAALLKALRPMTDDVHYQTDDEDEDSEESLQHGKLRRLTLYDVKFDEKKKDTKEGHALTDAVHALDEKNSFHKMDTIVRSATTPGQFNYRLVAPKSFIDQVKQELDVVEKIFEEEKKSASRLGRSSVG